MQTLSWREGHFPLFFEQGSFSQIIYILCTSLFPLKKARKSMIRHGVAPSACVENFKTHPFSSMSTMPLMTYAPEISVRWHAPSVLHKQPESLVCCWLTCKLQSSCHTNNCEKLAQAGVVL